MHRWKKFEDACAPVVVELGEEVGGVVGLHPGDEVADVAVVAILAELELVLVAELFEQVGFQLWVVLDGGDDLFALPVRSGFDQVGELGRMQPRELRVRDAQLNRRDVAGERLEARPVEEAGDAHARRQLSWQQPTEQALRADVDADDTPPALDAGDLDLVRAHEPGTVDVDQLPVEQVFPEQQLALSPLERLQVEPGLRERDPAVFDLADPLRRDEHVATRNLRDRAADRRILRHRRGGRAGPRSCRACGRRRR